MSKSIMPSAGARRVKKPARALVTGGAVRVGRAIALALADAGMDVAIGYFRSAAAARKTVSEIEARGVRGVAFRADLRDASAARRLVHRAARALGGLEVLVNNAAVFHRTPFRTTTPAAFDAILALNLRAPFFCAQAAVEVMGPRGGHIVNVADEAVARALPGYIPYALSKSAVIALTRNLAVALRKEGIAVNVVAPGPVLRPVGFPLARWKRLTRGHAAGVDDVALAVAYLATCPRSITGQMIVI
jgi:NAD(P)-dependent dehydrogenase (short-subunit alcohol dehydrogenase family)